jgi:hypothetical protein
MRQNTREVIRAWEYGTPHKRAESIWTDGERIMSYGTVLLEKVPGVGLVLNDTRYSVTTGNKQHSLRVYFRDRVRQVLDAVPMGAGRLDRFATGDGR